MRGNGHMDEAVHKLYEHFINSYKAFVASCSRLHFISSGKLYVQGKSLVQ